MATVNIETLANNLALGSLLEEVRRTLGSYMPSMSCLQVGPRRSNPSITSTSTFSPDGGATASMPGRSFRATRATSTTTSGR